MKNSYLDAIEAKDSLIRFLNDMIEVGFPEESVRKALTNIQSGFNTIQNLWHKQRTLEELLDLMNENESLEMNENEYMSVREFYEMHNTGFILEKVSYNDSYFRIAKLENR